MLKKFSALERLDKGNCQSKFEKYCNCFEKTEKEQNYSAEKALKNFSKLTGKNLKRIPLLVKLHLKLFLKKAPSQEFSDEFCEIFQSSFSSEHL